MINNKLDFFTPVRFMGQKTRMESIQQGLENYLSFGERAAYVIPEGNQKDSREVVIKNKKKLNKERKIRNSIKALSYCTLILPLTALCAKGVFRTKNEFHIKPIKVDPIPLPIMHESSVAGLMKLFTKAWNEKKGYFVFLMNPFHVENFIELLDEHQKRFRKLDFSDNEHFGYIEKFDLDESENPFIYVRADLHGDLKSLIENLRTLQEKGLLDENYKCKPGVHLVFLGDYCDRSSCGTQILELLIRLKEENPQQVHLIRGNHESIYMHQQYPRDDSRLQQVLEKDSKVLERFYQTMPLTTYFSIDGEKREYVQFTHGLFEMTMDPVPLLDQSPSGSHITVPKVRKFSLRVDQIANGVLKSHAKLQAAAKHLIKLDRLSNEMDNYLTAYNWADVTSNPKACLGSLGSRKYALTGKNIRAYLDLSSEKHQVKMILRGHEHIFEHLIHHGHLLVTTLPIGANCPSYVNQSDCAYILTPKPKVEDWIKQAILREKNQVTTDRVTKPYPMSSLII